MNNHVIDETLETPLSSPEFIRTTTPPPYASHKDSVVLKIFETIKPEILNKINENVQNPTIKIISSVVIPKTDNNFPENISKNSEITISPDSYKPKNKKLLTDSFYKVTGLDPLEYYVDKIIIGYEEKGLYDEEIKSKYMGYTQFDISIIFLPFVLARDLYCFSYNTAITPYIALRYKDNPLQYYYYIGIDLRRSMVTTKKK